jgi:hypothetical protein
MVLTKKASALSCGRGFFFPTITPPLAARGKP